jgi:hypothetical protein
VDELAALVTYPPIGACAAVLSGASSIRLWHDPLLYKRRTPASATCR